MNFSLTKNATITFVVFVCVITILYLSKWIDASSGKLIFSIDKGTQEMKWLRTYKY